MVNLWKGYLNISWTRPKKVHSTAKSAFPCHHDNSFPTVLVNHCYSTQTSISTWATTFVYTDGGHRDSAKVPPQPSAGPLWLWQEKVQQSLFLSRVINNKAQVENLKSVKWCRGVCYENSLIRLEHLTATATYFCCSADKAIKNNDSQTSLLSKLLTLGMKICQMIMNQMHGNNLTFNWKKWAQTPTELQFIWCQNTS